MNETGSKHVALIFIGTSKYKEFFPLWLEGVNKHAFNDCKKTILAFSDQISDPVFQQAECNKNTNLLGIDIPHLEWPFVTLLRFKHIHSALKKLEQSYPFLDNVLFLDADLIPRKDFSFSDVFVEGKPLTGVHHPGHFEGIVKNTRWNSVVQRGKTNANIRNFEGFENFNVNDKLYHQGCLWGGTFSAVLEMTGELSRLINEDLKNNIVADWHDESHMNCWFLRNYNDVHTLSPDFAWPNEKHWWEFLLSQGFTEPYGLHLFKPKEKYPRFQGGSPEIDTNLFFANLGAAFGRKDMMTSRRIVCDVASCDSVLEEKDMNAMTLDSWYFPNVDVLSKVPEGTGSFEHACLCCKCIKEYESK